MCGIFCQISPRRPDPITIEAQFNRIRYRGPDDHYLHTFPFGKNFVTIGFHRLSIHGLDTESNQPFFYPDAKNPRFAVVCNGEIYNSENIRGKFMYTQETHSDCEVLKNMYLDYISPPSETELLTKFEFQNFLKELDGVYAFLIIDFQELKIYQGRDPVGVRPLFRTKNPTVDLFEFASEGKALSQISVQVNQAQMVCYDFSLGIESVLNRTKVVAENTIYKFDPIDLKKKHHLDTTIHSVKSNLVDKLRKAVSKRLSSDREVGLFLSGGLDSSLVAALAQQSMSSTKGLKLRSFSIAIVPDELIMQTTDQLKEICPDIYYAEMVANKIGTVHSTVKVTTSDALMAIKDVIMTLETFDITTIRASVGMYLLSKWISENTNVKVVLSGEGSDELFGGYLYFHSAPDENAFQIETERLISELKWYDVLRSDRCTARFGLEVRVPFLDKEFLDYVNSIPPEFKLPRKRYRFSSNCKPIEKWVLRDAFSTSTKIDELLPETVLWRQKDAFSDAVGYNWVTSIQVYLKSFEKNEKSYYREITRKAYKKVDIPGYWMPRWTNASDPSARKLKNHNSFISNT